MRKRQTFEPAAAAQIKYEFKLNPFLRTFHRKFVASNQTINSHCRMKNRRIYQTDFTHLMLQFVFAFQLNFVKNERNSTKIHVAVSRITPFQYDV